MGESADADRIAILSDRELGRTLSRLATQVLESVDNSRSLMLLVASDIEVKL